MRKNIIIGILAAWVVFGSWVRGWIHKDRPVFVHVQGVMVEAIEPRTAPLLVQIQGKEVVGFSCTVNGFVKVTECWVASK
jgi:hypothetical protein